jgi:hypothetical protein
MAIELVKWSKERVDAKKGALWYIGGGRNVRTSIDNVGMPENLSNSEIFAAFRRDNALIRNLNGSKLGTAQIREFMKDGTIEFHVVSINDPNPKVCDKAEEIAQKMLLQTHYASSTIRTIAAGTVCTGNKVDKGGYRIFGWVMNAQDDPRFRVVKFSQCRMVLSKEEVVCVTTRPQECEQTNPKPSEIPAMTVLAKHTKFEKQVRMQCLGNGHSKRAYISEVSGTVHTRQWGLPHKPEKWIKLILDFGEGGEHAAEESHNKILRSKTSEAYRKRRGAYTILRDDQPFCTDKGKSTKEEKAEDELIFLRYNFAAKNYLNQIYLDSDDDDDEGTDDTDENF